MNNVNNNTINNESIIRPLKGTNVITLDDAKLKTEIIDVIRKVARNYGYGEMSTPITYDKELLTYKFDDEAELADEIYSVTDRGERRLGLRYDLTMPFARFVAENAKSLSYPFKRFEVGEVFRDGPVKSGRARQFTQCDMDIVGDSNPVVTACEQMSMMISVFDALGFCDVKVKYSSRKAVNGILFLLGIDEDKRAQVIRIMDKKDKVADEAFENELANAGLEKEQIEQLREWMGYSVRDCQEYLAALDILEIADGIADNEELVNGLYELTRLSKMISIDEELASRCVLDLSLVRGQDYYTGIMFEAFADGFPSSLAGGGRYESIIGSLASEKDASAYSASGVSFGIVPIMYVVKNRTEMRTDDENSESGDAKEKRCGCVIITCSETDVPSALTLARRARVNKFVEVDATSRSVSKKLKAANKARYAFVIVYGENERKTSKINVKNMDNGSTLSMETQTFVMLDEDDLRMSSE